jgi:hypothetical protein
MEVATPRFVPSGSRRPSAALFRFYQTLGIRWFNPLAQTGVTLQLILVVLIAVDWRMGERRRWACPLLLAANVVQYAAFPCSPPRDDDGCAAAPYDTPLQVSSRR